jgi:hypothetical protein
MIRFEEEIKEKIKNKLEEMLGFHEESSNESVEVPRENTINSSDRR